MKYGNCKCLALMRVAEYMISILLNPYLWLYLHILSFFFLHPQINLQSVDVKFEILISRFCFNKLYGLFNSLNIKTYRI